MDDLQYLQYEVTVSEICVIYCDGMPSDLDSELGIIAVFGHGIFVFSYNHRPL